MTTIHVQRVGTSPGYRAWIHGQHDWCYGFGTTWKEAVGDLLHTFEATLGLGLHVAPELDPVPLDGLAAENACEGCQACQTDLADIHKKFDAFLADNDRPALSTTEDAELFELREIANQLQKNAELAERAAGFEVP